MRRCRGSRRPWSLAVIVAWLILAQMSGIIDGVTLAQVAELRAIAEKVRRNEQELRVFDWKQRLQVTVNGEIREVTLVAAHYDGHGDLIKTPLPDKVPDSSGAASAPRTQTRKRGRKARELNDGLIRLIAAYTELTPERMQSILARANVRPDSGDNESTMRVQVRSVIHQGDSMDAWVDADTKLPRRFEIFTSLEGEPVHLVTEFAEIEGGPNYPARTVVKTELKKKKIVITAENFDYVRDGD